MKLNRILESIDKNYTFYKGMKKSNFDKFKQHKIPGFLSDLYMALVYCDPKSQQIDEPIVVISTNINIDMIEDLRNEIDDMCGNWQNPKHQKYDELRSKIWWSTSGGQPVDNYKILFVANDSAEFNAKIQDPAIKKIINRHNKEEHNDEKRTWKEFL